MHSDLLNILSRKVQPITNEQLLDYLTDKLTDSERHEIEASLLNSAVDAEALEGLQMIGEKEKIQQYQREIQKALREKLQQKTTKRQRSKHLQLSFLLILTGAILCLVLLVWVIIQLLQNNP